MGARVLAGYLDEDELRTVVTALSRPNSFFILEEPTQLHLGHIGQEDAAAWPETYNPATQEEGRLFNDNFELRWQRLRGYPPSTLPFRVRVISDEANLLGAVAGIGWQGTDGKSATVQYLQLIGDESFYLWGEFAADGAKPPRWYEKEVPRMFAYPLISATARRVKLKIREYAMPNMSLTEGDEDPEAFSIHRFVAFIPEQE